MRRFFVGLMAFAILYAHEDVEQRVKDYFFTPDISTLPVSDWLNPTPRDYLLIQDFLKKKVRSIVDIPLEKRIFNDDCLNREFHGWITYRMDRGCLAIDEVQEPKFCIDYLNNDPNDKDKCVICYASFPSGSPLRDYPRAIQHMLKALQEFNFDGHFIYQIGGFPNVKKGRLNFADVPFSFKPFLFEEIRELGYKNILWLDACCIPVRSLSPIFKFIKKKGLCFYSYRSIFHKRKFNEGYSFLLPSLNQKKLLTYEQISSQVVGINVDHKKANHLLDLWIKAAEKKTPFLFSDELPFVYLVNRLNLLQGRLPKRYYVETPCNTGDFCYWKSNPQAIIYHQYDFLDPEYPVPDEIFHYRRR